MAQLHPGVQLLLLSGLLIFWLIPLSSWLMLRGQRDRHARLWFLGTASYAISVTFFVFSSRLPMLVYGPLGSTLAMLSVLLMSASLRMELPVPHAPRRLYVLLAAAYFGVLAWMHQFNRYALEGRVMHQLLISLAEFYVISLAIQVRQRYKSRAMVLVIAVFLIYALSNLARVAELALTGRYSQLLDFTPMAQLGLLVNYLSPIFYSYGYWGFVLEKKQHRLVQATEETVLAREAEKLAEEREQLAREALRERTELIERLTVIGKQAQAGALSASIAHEMNQPLAAIQLNVEEAQRFAGEYQAPEPLRRLLQRIAQDNQRAAEIVRRVRSLFTQSTGQQQSQVLDKTVVLVVDMMSRRARDKRVQIKLALNAPEPFLCGAGEVEHVIMNLLENAFDALEASPPAQRQIEIRTWHETGWVIMSVTDNGPGVPVALRERIFDLYQTSKPKGLGLGLWLARYIAERHGGQLVLDKQHIDGACFVLRLPQR